MPINSMPHVRIALEGTLPQYRPVVEDWLSASLPGIAEIAEDRGRVVVLDALAGHMKDIEPHLNELQDLYQASFTRAGDNLPTVLQGKGYIERQQHLRSAKGITEPVGVFPDYNVPSKILEERHD